MSDGHTRYAIERRIGKLTTLEKRLMSRIRDTKSDLSLAVASRVLSGRQAYPIHACDRLEKLLAKLLAECSETSARINDAKRRLERVKLAELQAQRLPS